MATNRYFLPVGYGGSAGNWPGSASGKTSTVLSHQQTPNDFGAFDPVQGVYVNARTKLPWTGTLPNGQYSAGGKIADDPAVAAQKALANDPSKRYQPVDIVKSPAVAGSTNDLMGQFKQGADKSLKGFDDYVSQFKSDTTSAMNRQKQATDVGPVINNLSQAQSRYAGTLNQNSADYKALNDQAAAAETGIVTRANDLLPGYDTALTNAENLAQQQVTGAVSRYGMGKNASAGASLGMGSDIGAIAAQKSYEASLPYEQAKIAKRYDILQNYDLPVQRDIANRETMRIASYNPTVAAQIYGTDQDTQVKIQSLKEAAASRDWQTAMQILQVPQLAAQIRQQIMAGDTSLLQSLSALEEGSHYRGLQDILGINLSQPNYYGTGSLGYDPAPPASRRYRDLPPNVPRPVAPGLTPANAPVPVGPMDYARDYTRMAGNDPRRYTNDPDVNGYWDEATGDFYKYGDPAYQPPMSVGPQTRAGYEDARKRFYVSPYGYNGDVNTNPALEGMA